MSALAAANEPGVNGVALAVLIFFFVLLLFLGIPRGFLLLLF